MCTTIEPCECYKLGVICGLDSSQAFAQLDIERLRIKLAQARTDEEQWHCAASSLANDNARHCEELAKARADIARKDAALIAIRTCEKHEVFETINRECEAALSPLPDERKAE